MHCQDRGTPGLRYIMCNSATLMFPNAGGIVASITPAKRLLVIHFTDKVPVWQGGYRATDAVERHSKAARGGAPHQRDALDQRCKCALLHSSWAACVLSGDTERSLLQHLQLLLLAADAAFGLGRRLCVGPCFPTCAICGIVPAHFHSSLGTKFGFFDYFSRIADLT